MNPIFGGDAIANVTIANFGDDCYRSFTLALLCNDRLIESKYVSSITKNETKSFQIVGKICDVGDVTLKIVADYYNNVYESNESNNAFAANFSIIPPDLIVSNISYELLGNRIKLVANATNIGNDFVGSVNLKFNITAGNYSKSLYSSYSGLWRRNESKEFISYWYNLISGRVRVNAYVDYNNRIPESDESNNEIGREITIAFPDLVLTSLSVNVTDSNSNSEFDVEIKCLGENVTSNFWIVIKDEDRVVSSLVVNGIKKNESKRLKLYGRLNPGYRNVSAIVDYYSNVIESNEINNAVSIAVYVPSPDLRVVSLRVNKKVLSSGEPLNITAEICNYGDSISKTSYLAFLRNSKLIKTLRVPSLANNSCLNLSTTWNVQGGDYSIRAFADYYNNNYESNESNNEAYINISVTLPDIWIKSVNWLGNEAGDISGFNVCVESDNGTLLPFYVGLKVDGIYRGIALVDGIKDSEIKCISLGSWKGKYGLHRVEAIADFYNSVLESNESNNSLEVTINVPDKTPPIIEYIKPKNGSVVSNATVEVKLTDRGSGVDLQNSSVEVSNAIGQKLIVGDKIVFTPTSISDGLHYVTVHAVDNAGNSKDYIFEFVLDRSAPRIQIVNVSEGATYYTAYPDVNITDENEFSYWAKLNGRNYDFEPIKEDGSYTLTVYAIDIAGNTARDEVNFTVNGAPRPPSNLKVFKIGNKTKITWYPSPDKDVAGYNVYLDGTKLNSELVEDNYFITNRSGSFGVTAVDFDGHESEKATISPISVELLNEILHAKYFENMMFHAYSEKNVSASLTLQLLDELGNIIKSYSLGNHEIGNRISNETVLIPPKLKIIKLIVSTSEGETVYYFKVNVTAEEGLSVILPERIYENFPEEIVIKFRNLGSSPITLNLKDSKVSLNGHTGVFKRNSVVINPNEIAEILTTVIGDSGKLKIILNVSNSPYSFSFERNVSAERKMPLIVEHESLEKGKRALFDLIMTNYGNGRMNIVKHGVELLSNGRVIASEIINDNRILDGYRSDVLSVELTPPLNSPDILTVKAFVEAKVGEETIFYNDSHIASTVLPPYDGNATLSKSKFRRGEVIEIHGYSFDNNKTIIPNKTLKISISSKGFTRNFFVKTDEKGRYNFSFKPTPLEAGRFIVSVTHPDVTALEKDAEFEIIGLYVNPTEVLLEVPINFTSKIPVTVSNIGESNLTDIHFECNSIYAKVPKEHFNLTPGEKRRFYIMFKGYNSKNSTFVINVISNEMRESINVTMSVREPKPFVYPMPVKIEVGAKPNEVVTKTFKLVNLGFAPMKNVSYASDISWISFVSTPNTIQARNSTPVDILIKPNQSGIFDGRIIVKSDNYRDITIPIRIVVTPNETGDVKFIVKDSVGNSLENATVSIINPLFNLTAKTSDDGIAEMKNVPIGLYKYYVHKENYETVSGEVVVDKGVEKTVNITMLYTFLKVEWRVLPIKILDKYVVVHNITYDSKAPVPYVEFVTNDTFLLINYSYLKENGYVIYRGNITIKNDNQYLSVFNVTPKILSKSDLVDIEFGVDRIPELKPNESVTIPYVVKIHYHHSPTIDPCKSYPITFTITGEQKCITEDGKVKTYYVPAETYTIHIKPICFQAFLSFASLTKDAIGITLKYTSGAEFACIAIDAGSTAYSIWNYANLATQCVSGYYGSCVNDKDSCIKGIRDEIIKRIPVAGDAYTIYLDLKDFASKAYGCFVQNSCPQHECEQPHPIPNQARIISEPLPPIYTEGFIYGLPSGGYVGERVTPSVDECKEAMMGGSSVKTYCAYIKQTNQAICVRIKLEIKQSLTMERQAFDAMLKLTNTANLTFENVSVKIIADDMNGKNSTGNFFIKVSSVSGVAKVNNFTLHQSKTAEIHWLIIPKAGAGGEFGKKYSLRAVINGSVSGSKYSFVTWPDVITVEPMPILSLDYVLPKKVYGDNPFTPEKEKPIPFVFGVRVKNIGYGLARNLTITSAQPKIVERSLGAYINFRIIGTVVNGRNASNTLTINFGDIKPGKSSTAVWYMTAEMTGDFTEYNASFTHDDSLGGKETSLIKEVRTHWLLKAFSNTIDDDGMMDFLVDDNRDGNPEKIIDSTGFDYDVLVISNKSVTAENGMKKITFDYIGNEWVYLSVPVQEKRVKVFRSDGSSPIAYWIENGNLSILDHGPVKYYVFKAIKNKPPIALLSVTPTPIFVNQSVEFNASSSYDPDGSIISYSWDFGDGSNATTIQPFVTHRYEQTGDYTVVLTVMDDDSATNSTSKEIYVTIKGDFSGNGKIDVSDVNAVAWMVIGKVKQDLRADFNNNGRVDIGDLAKIAYYLLGKINEL